MINVRPDDLQDIAGFKQEAGNDDNISEQQSDHEEESYNDDQYDFSSSVEEDNGTDKVSRGERNETDKIKGNQDDNDEDDIDAEETDVKHEDDKDMQDEDIKETSVQPGATSAEGKEFEGGNNRFRSAEGKDERHMTDDAARGFSNTGGNDRQGLPSDDEVSDSGNKMTDAAERNDEQLFGDRRGVGSAGFSSRHPEKE